MPRFCAHLGYLFTELPLAERFAAAKEAGFDAIEHPSPYGFGISAFAELARAHDVAVAQIAAPSGDSAKGEKGFACLADRTEAFQTSVETGIAAAVEIGTPLMHVMPGVLPEGMSREGCRDTYLSHLSWAADRCAENGITALVEPISDETVAGFYVNHPDFAAELLAELDHPDARMLFDVYHAAVKRLDPIAFIDKNFERIAHIQIADFPGRHEPGTGSLPYSQIFSHLDTLSFDGWVGCEYKPRNGTNAGLGWLTAY